MNRQLSRTLSALVLLTMLSMLSLTLVSQPLANAQTDRRYFQETHHWVQGLFLQYWNAHGGLAQQGYPLTEEFREINKLDGQTYTVQYFERAILERHPENAGTPYEVLLTQLGTFESDSRYPNNSNPAAAPQPSPKPAPPTAIPTLAPPIATSKPPTPIATPKPPPPATPVPPTPTPCPNCSFELDGWWKGPMADGGIIGFDVANNWLTNWGLADFSISGCPQLPTELIIQAGGPIINNTVSDERTFTRSGGTMKVSLSARFTSSTAESGTLQVTGNGYYGCYGSKTTTWTATKQPAGGVQALAELVQQPQPQTVSRYFPETHHNVQGLFLQYWNEHGGLAQQGYPLTEEFQEINKLDGQTYTVQYFERAILERHPEFAGTSNEVLLSQLGKFELDSRYPNNNNPAAATVGISTPPALTPISPNKATPTTPPPPTRPSAATATPSATAPPAPTNPPNPCADVPVSRNATVTPSCGTTSDIYNILIMGFAQNEGISFWVTAPNGNVAGTPAPLQIGDHGPNLSDYFRGSDFVQLAALVNSHVEGIWAVTYQGASSQHQSIVYIKIHR